MERGVIGPAVLNRAPAVTAAGAALALILAGCAGPPQPRAPAPSDGSARADRPGGVYHVLRRGETVWRVARRYGVDVETLVRANGIEDVTDVPTGARLWIPGRSGPAASPPETGIGGVRAQTEEDLSFAWPLQARISSAFGGRRGGRHEGVDLAAPAGTPVRAAEAGRVVYSGNGLGDYGNVVILKHVGSFATVYAHHRRNRVREGQLVEKGALIGEVGDTGNATRPHLHFEIRRGDEPLDPLRWLP